MTYHMGVLGAVLLISLIYALNKYQSLNIKKTCIILITVILSLFLGLRTWMMADVAKYHTQFLNCGGPEWRIYVFEKPENIGLRLFFYIEHKLTGGNFQIALLIIAFFCMSCLGYIVYKYSTSVYWSYLMYISIGFYFFNFSGLKQSVAMALLLLAFRGIVEDRLSYFLIMTFLAGIFHAPAFIFLPAYMFAQKKINRNYFLILAAAFFVTMVFRGRLVSLLNELYYDDERMYDQVIFVGGKFVMMVAMLAGGLVLQPLNTKDETYGKVFNLMVIATLLQSFGTFGNNFTRLADYYFQFVVLYVPFIMENRIHRRHTLSKYASRPIVRMNQKYYTMLYLTITLFAFYYYYNYIKTDISGILDLKFFWEVAQTGWGT